MSKCPECDDTRWFSPTNVHDDGWPCEMCKDKPTPWEAVEIAMKPPTPEEMAYVAYHKLYPHMNGQTPEHSLATYEGEAMVFAIQAERDRARAAVPSWDSTLDIAEGDEPCCCGECRECGYNQCRKLVLESLGGEEE